jgi:hypothetical protein
MAFEPTSLEDAIGGFAHAAPVADGLPRAAAAPAAAPAFPSDRDGRVRRPPNAYNLYFHERVPAERLAHPDFTGNQISQFIGQRWAQMDEEQRRPYREQAQALQRRFREEHPDYHYRKAPDRLWPAPRARPGAAPDDTRAIEAGIRNAFTFLGSQLIAAYLLQNRELLGDAGGLGKAPGIEDAIDLGLPQ